MAVYTFVTMLFAYTKLYKFPKLSLCSSSENTTFGKTLGIQTYFKAKFDWQTSFTTKKKALT